MRKALAVAGLFALAILAHIWGNWIVKGAEQGTTPSTLRGSTDQDSIAPPHRWASDVLKEKSSDQSQWQGMVLMFVHRRPTPKAERCQWRNVPNSQYLIEKYPADCTDSDWQELDRYTLDWCLLHGETRVLHSKEKPAPQEKP